VRLAGLFSGGKDSTYSILRAKEMGHETVCLITIHPAADDSPLFHYPNIKIAKLLAESMQIPLIEFTVSRSSKIDETRALEDAIVSAKAQYPIDGILSGGVASRFQKQTFDDICSSHSLESVAPIWGLEPRAYMQTLLDRGFRIMIVSISAMGLEEEWLGVVLDQASLDRLDLLSRKYGFNLNFEGGEAETLVVDCPLFQKRLEVLTANSHWDGQRGIFEIREAVLVEK
jgi:ABC transporter with metal-binding/Fe-S-binding domain ATP-binding protein